MFCAFLKCATADVFWSAIFIRRVSYPSHNGTLETVINKEDDIIFYQILILGAAL